MARNLAQPDRGHAHGVIRIRPNVGLDRFSPVFSDHGPDPLPLSLSVARESVYVHSHPGPAGYGRRLLVAAGGHVIVPNASDTTIAVSDLLAPQP
jgi:hypothetical protein